MARPEDLAPLVPAEAAVRRMLEEASADAVVLLWTSQKKRSTRIYRHQVGNRMLCDALVAKIAEEQMKPEGEA